MYIEKINIKSFGRLSDVSFELSPKINLFEGDNETGKTTVASFVKFMLYGLSPKSPDGGTVSERKKYIGWNTGIAAGSMSIVTDDGRHVLIERVLTESTTSGGSTAYREAVKMTDENTGGEIFHGEVPGEALFGVPEEIFTSTAFIRRLGGAGIDGSKLSATAENLLFSADESVSADKAISKLDDARRKLLHKNGKGGLIYELERERDEKGELLSRAMSDASGQIALEGALESAKMNLEDAERDLAAARQKSENFDAVRNLRRFDELHSVKSELNGIYSEMNTYVAENTKNGHFPNARYIESLTSSTNALRQAGEEIEAASEALDAVESERRYGADIELDESLDDENVRDDIIYDVESRHRNKVSLTVTALLCFFMMAGCVAAAYFLADNLSSTWQIGLLAAGVLFGVCAIIITIAAAVSSHNCSRLLKKYGARNVKGIEAALDAMAENLKYERENGDRRAELEAELEVKKSAYEEELAGAEKLIYVRSPELAGEDIMKALSGTLSECRTIYAGYVAISARAEDKKHRIEEIIQMTDGADETAIRALTSKINVSEYEALKPDDIKRQLTFAENRTEQIKGRIHELELKLSALGKRDDPARLEVEYEALTNKISAYRQRYDAILLAIDALSGAGRAMRESVTPRLRESAKRYLSRITGERYKSVLLDSSFRMTVEADGAYRELDFLSGGTTDCAYLSLRLALTELLFGKEAPPLIFDEAFASTDDERTAAALSMLASSKGQTLLFTCRSREGELLAEIDGGNASFSLLKLQI
ncbi:MAG: AAA family ATPase [Firmicutes bacterium]|nr:AAA family ATPase [Bacillota bacterium]